MYITDHLTQTERDNLTQQLTDQQNNFISNLLKRGRRTIFANVLAKEKASSSDEDSIVEVASQWELLDYIDAGPNWNVHPAYFCKCGRPLRYQYIVKNKETAEVKKFGITHFEMHVGIPSHLVKEIVKGFETIDFERDEILIKIANDWSLEDEGIRNIPSEIEIPSDIKQHFDYDIPLLERQVNRLNRLISEHHRHLEKQRLDQERIEREELNRRKMEAYKNSKVSMSWSRDGKQSLEVGVLIYLENLEHPDFLASEVCEELVVYFGASNARYSSGTLKIFPEVCIILESLVKQGKLTFIGKKNGTDRIYQILEKQQDIIIDK